MNKYGDFSKGQFWNDLANSTGNHGRDTTTQKVQGRSFTSIHADSPIVHDNPEPLDPSETKTANVTGGLAVLDDVGQNRDVCQQINVLNRSIELQIYRGDDDAS